MGTTVEKADYAFETKDLLKTEINKINNVLDDNSTFRSYPQELFNGYLDILNNGTDTLWNNLEKVSQTGTEAVLEGVETAPMKVELQGNTQQNGEPTPDTPIPVQVVTGNNVVSVSAKNLLDISYLVEANADKTYVSQGFWAFKLSDKIGTYTLSRENADMVASGSYIAWGEGADITTAYNRKTWIAHQNQSNLNNKKQTKTNSGELWLFLSTNETRIQNIPNDYGYLMLEQNSQATPYVPYSKTDYPISLGTIELCKIGNYKDYFHKDSGKWYVHKEIGKKVFDGTETLNKSTSTSADIFSFALGNEPSSTETTETKCNYLKYVSSNAVGSCRKYSRNIYLIPYEYGTATINEFKATLSTLYANGNPYVIYYILATPTEEEITNTTLIEQLEAISKAKSVKDKTYITQTNDELPFILDVEAIKEYEVV